MPETDLVSSLLAGNLEKTAEPPAPEGYYYRVLFESGMPEVGFSRLAPKEFVDLVVEEARRDGWVRFDDGDGFRASRAISVKVVPPEDES